MGLKSLVMSKKPYQKAELQKIKNEVTKSYDANSTTSMQEFFEKEVVEKPKEQQLAVEVAPFVSQEKPKSCKTHDFDIRHQYDDKTDTIEHIAVCMVCDFVKVPIKKAFNLRSSAVPLKIEQEPELKIEFADLAAEYPKEDYPDLYDKEGNFKETK